MIIMFSIVIFIRIIMGKESIDGLGVLLLGVVGLLWGGTNPLIEKSVK